MWQILLLKKPEPGWSDNRHVEKMRNVLTCGVAVGMLFCLKDGQVLHFLLNDAFDGSDMITKDDSSLKIRNQTVGIVPPSMM